eukprot:GHVL01025255.1.p1 GENE.GHVL01025255.1~~GHVL01025255.1.p1  ORF type:complete len:314 (+),score=61.16 GHVL01025255.1:33-974(+)
MGAGATSSPIDAKYDDNNPTISSFINKNNLKIAYYKWDPEKPAKAIVIACHGIVTHTRFDWLAHPGNCFKNGWADLFLRENIAFYAYDHQGHGLSDGWNNYRGSVKHFDDFADDLIQFHYLIKNENNKKLPIYWLGESMGGCVVATATAKICDQNENLPDGIIMVAPMLSVDNIKAKTENRILLPISTVLANTVPNMQLVKIQRNEMFPEIQKELDDDPLTYKGGKIRANLAFECLKAVERAVSLAAHIYVPVILLHSSKDTMCEPQGSQRFYDALPHGKRKDLIIVDDMWHSLSQEPGHEKLHKKIVDWINK